GHAWLNGGLPLASGVNSLGLAGRRSIRWPTTLLGPWLTATFRRARIRARHGRRFSDPTSSTPQSAAGSSQRRISTKIGPSSQASLLSKESGEGRARPGPAQRGWEGVGPEGTGPSAKPLTCEFGPGGQRGEILATGRYQRADGSSLRPPDRPRSVADRQLLSRPSTLN
ncbi:MAG: hypothetical protein AVDCRST_MAG93-3212, partial [uncultured Chloroflexia bacterium]